MPLAPGIKLGHYEIIAPLGAGGMGEVYRARDSVLKREVAVKILPDSYSSDPERLRRFQQEAEAAAALNHPNILTVHQVGRQDGISYLVTELLQGETLRDKLRRGPLPVRTTVDYAVQIARGLETAHENGIVHRDLKPENLFVTKDGRVKILDFGLAKLTQPQLDPLASTQAVINDTAAGAVMGTVGYMSPEQVRGQTADARSDIFAFGAVLFEMLTGNRAFHGTTYADTVSAVLHHDPPISELTANQPPGLQRIISRCLQKNREQRFHSAADLAFAIEALSDTPSGIQTAAPVRNSRLLRWVKWGIAAALVLAALSIGWYRHRSSSPTGAQPQPAALKLVPLTTYPGIEQQPSLSPDGSQVAFSWNGRDQANFNIYVKTTGPGPPLRLTTDTADDVNPAWSPDGSSIAYLRKMDSGTEFSVMQTSALGGPQRKLADVSIPETSTFYAPYMSWLPDSQSLIITDRPLADKPAALFILSVRTGEKRQLTFPPTGTLGDHCAAVSPDGKALAFRRANPAGQWSGSIYVQALDNSFRPRGESRQVTPQKFFDFKCVSWTADSQRLVFPYGLGVWTLPVSPDSGDLVRGEARMAVETGDGVSWTSVARTSTRLAYAHTTGGGDSIWRMRIPGPHESPEPPVRFIASTKGEFAQQYSPDGRKIVFESYRGGNLEIWVCGSEGEDCSQLTAMGAPQTGVPSWSPDGRQIAFYSNQEGKSRIFVIPADGGAVRRMTSGSGSAIFARWSRDGKWIYFSSRDTGPAEIWKVPASGGPAMQVTHHGGFASSESPDGKWLYFTREFAQDTSLWKMPAVGGEEVQVLLLPYLHEFRHHG